MAEFAKYYVDFLWNALQNIWNFIYSILYAFYKIVVLDTINYFKALGAVVGNFDVLGWICLIWFLSSISRSSFLSYIAWSNSSADISFTAAKKWKKTN